MKMLFLAHGFDNNIAYAERNLFYIDCSWDLPKSIKVWPVVVF